MLGTFKRRLRLLALAVLYGGVAALVAATLLAELGETWWIADLFAHFRYHYGLGALLLAAAAMALGRRGTALAAACLIAPQIWAVAAPPRTPVHEGVGATPLRVMSVNVLAINRRFDDVVAAVERQKPDVLALQEVSRRWHPAVERLAAQFPYVAPSNWRTHLSDNILLSRLPIRASRVVVPPRQHRAFAHVEATILIGGAPVRVLAVHPPLPSGRLYTTTRQVHFDYYARLGAVSDRPLLIVGDFNITPYSPRFRSLLREGRLRYVHLGWSWPATWPSESRGRLQGHLRGFPIDHILTSRHFAVKGAWTLDDVGSDHYPVVADLVLH